MKNVKRWIVAALILVVLAAALLGYGLFRSRPSPANAVAASRDSSARAAHVAAILERFENGDQARGPEPRVQRIDESELNAYILEQIRHSRPDGLESLRVQLKERDRVVVEAVVDMDKLRLKRNDMATRLFRTLLRGRQVLEVDGRLSSAAGKAVYRPISMSINDIDLPGTLVQTILGVVGRKQKPPIDFTEPFPMPYNIRQVRIYPGYVELS